MGFWCPEMAQKITSRQDLPWGCAISQSCPILTSNLIYKIQFLPFLLLKRLPEAVRKAQVYDLPVAGIGSFAVQLGRVDHFFPPQGSEHIG